MAFRLGMPGMHKKWLGKIQCDKKGKILVMWSPLLKCKKTFYECSKIIYVKQKTIVSTVSEDEFEPLVINTIEMGSPWQGKT